MYHAEDHHLPLGPVFTSPDGLVSSFKREVIDKQPDFLKTQILTAVKEAYPMKEYPFVCGFGNKNTDAKAYRNVWIRSERIFIISEKSEIYSPSSDEFKSSYPEML